MEIFETHQELYGARCPICHKVGSIGINQTHRNSGLDYSIYWTYTFKCTNCGFESYQADKDFLLNNIKEVLDSCDMKTLSNSSQEI